MTVATKSQVSNTPSSRTASRFPIALLGSMESRPSWRCATASRCWASSQKSKPASPRRRRWSRTTSSSTKRSWERNSCAPASRTPLNQGSGTAPWNCPPTTVASPAHAGTNGPRSRSCTCTCSKRRSMVCTTPWSSPRMPALLLRTPATRRYWVNPGPTRTTLPAPYSTASATRMACWLTHGRR